MGAAASMKMVYKDAFQWFHEYFNAETYLEDFKSIDLDHDGYIQFRDLELWIKDKAQNTGGPWKHFLQNPQIYQMAHEHASRYLGDSTILMGEKKVVDVLMFRELLVQLFAISILWLHFKKADEYLLARDAYNFMMNRTEFKLGVRSFCAAYGHEHLTDDQLDEDFNSIDAEGNEKLSFKEVCDFCCQFIDPRYIIDLSRKGSSNKKSEEELQNENEENQKIIEDASKFERVEEQIIQQERGKSEFHAFTEFDRKISSGNETGHQIVTKAPRQDHDAHRRPSDFPAPLSEAKFNQAIENVVATVEKNQIIQHLEEVKLTTEIELLAQGFGSLN